MKRGIGTIDHFSVRGDIATLVLSVRSKGGFRSVVVHGETRLMLDALTAIFQIQPPPAPPTDVTGKRVRYRRDGAMLMSLEEI